MLKVKRPVYTPKNNKHETEINEIKTAIKKMFLTNQTNKKSLNDYSQLVTKIGKEYNILVKENEGLKSQLEQYKNYYDVNIVRQKKPDVSYRKRKPNDRYSYHNDEDDDEDDELKNNYIPKRKSKRFKKREIIYKDLVDDYEPSSPTEDKEGIDDETGEEDDDEIYETGKTKKQQQKSSKTKIIEVIQKTKTKKINKKGITKTIKM